MKSKILMTLALLVCSLGTAMAQEQEAKTEFTPEERARHKAEIVAQKILLSDADAAKFIPVYESYVLETRAIMQKYKPERPQRVEGQTPAVKTDAQIDAEIRAQFKKSQELLDLREAYYEKYLKIISPRQIREMYKMERQVGERARQKHSGRQR